MAFIVLALWVSARFVIHPTRVSPVHPAWQSAYEALLAHTAHALRHFENPLAGLPPQIPGAGGLIPQLAAIGVAVPLAPVTLWAGPGVAFALWLVLGFAGTAATAYWALSRHLVGSRVAAAIGALVFAFAPGILWHANGQPDFVTNLLIPVILVRVARLGQGRPVRDGVILGVLVVAQLLVNPELLAITAFAGGYAVLCHRFDRGGRPRTWVPRWPSSAPGRATLTGLAVAAGTSLVLLAYPLWYRFASDPDSHVIPVPAPRLGEDPTTLALYWRDTLAGNFTADRSIGGIEQNTWFGWPLLILAGLCVTVFWGRSVAVRVATLTTLPFGVLALGSQIRLNGAPTPVPGPWWVLAKVPGLQLVAPTHLALVLIPCLAVILAASYDLLPSGEPVRYGLTQRRLWILLFAVALIPNAPRPLQANPNLGAVPKFIAAGAWRAHVTGDQTVVPVPSAPDSASPYVVQAVGLNEFDVPDPYLAGDSRTGQLLHSVADTGSVPLVTADMQATTRAELRSWDAGVVMVPPGKYAGAVRQTLSNLVGRQPQWIDGAWIWDVRQFTRGG
jgi:hypothetical protein